ncbi:MAG TPA: O-antigen ligase family protein [Terriglobia bacterium]|nr:O-antigen ligase family protein [Terriglobia bacterium]
MEFVWSPLYLPGALFLLLGLVQLLTHRTVDSISTRNSMIELAGVLVSFSLTLQLSTAKNPDAWRTVGLGVIVYTFAMALFAVIQYLSSGGKLFWRITPHTGGWIFGPYVNHDHYAGLMEMLIPLSAGFAMALYRRHRVTIAISFAILFAIASVLLSGSRGGLICLLLEAGLFLFALLENQSDRRASSVIIQVAAALAIAFVAFLWMDSGQVVKHLETVFEPSHASDVSFTYRRQTALDSLRLFREHWPLGTGLGSFQYGFPKYQSLPGDAVWDHAHDDFVEALAETGVAGGLLVLSALIIWFRLAFRRLRQRLRTGSGWIQFGAALGCCGLLLHSLFDFNLHIPANALWFAVCAALATAPTSMRQLPQS